MTDEDERPYILLLSSITPIKEHADSLELTKNALRAKTELLMSFTNGVVIGFVTAEDLESLSIRLGNEIRDKFEYLIIEPGKQWEARGFNVAYRWLRQYVHDSSLRKP